jgi:hypothetical protein
MGWNTYNKKPLLSYLAGDYELNISEKYPLSE